MKNNFFKFFILTFLIFTSSCNVLKIVVQEDTKFDDEFFGSTSSSSDSSESTSETTQETTSIQIPEFNNNLKWLTHIGGNLTPDGNSSASLEYCTGVVTDSNGNVYCSGFTQGSLGEPNGGGPDDAFIMKLNGDGELQWITQLGGITEAGGDTMGYDRCNDIAVDSEDNIYCGCQTRSDLGETNAGSIDACIIKLNSDGEVVFVKQLGQETLGPASAVGNDSCDSIAIDKDDNIYCAGTTASDLGEANGGGIDAYVAKFDSAGNYQWIRQIGANTIATIGTGDAAGNDYCTGVDVDDNGNVYCAGHTTSNLTDNLNGAEDLFMMKLNSEGEVQWLTQLGQNATQNSTVDSSGIDRCNDLKVNDKGHLFCSGVTQGNLGANNAGSNDLIVVKIDQDGNLDWVYQIGDVGNDAASSIAIDNDNSIYVAGNTTSSLNDANAGSDDALIIKLTEDGGQIWTTQIGTGNTPIGGSATGIDKCMDVHVDSIGQVFCAGLTDGNLGDIQGGVQDAFIMKLYE